ncbi:putative phosphoglycerate mutase [Lachnellula occidentalis]|uniref:Putative phosphoglycerate mutase n=1 Tax=Lachnellula occidentalis TaxID=215460 RepID=A0A8H8UAA3_9HELO|nr:putative phosphoglycerate mutase [Lachnellula occidentalis]
MLVKYIQAVSWLAVTCTANWTPSPTSAPEYTSPAYIKYSTVPGFFLQDDNATVPGTFDYTATNFGLVNRTYPTNHECNDSFTQWQKFKHFVDTLNVRSGKDVDYKILFLGRHGEGYHNVAESYYGTPAWNCYWSIRDGNGTSVWADAKITPNGVAQAQIAADFWASRIKLQKIPLPQSYYVSPLTRCLQTANITFSQLPLSPLNPFVPTVKELFREGISGHTCDRRGNKTYIHNAFPRYHIEAGFSEEDLLFKPLEGEVPTDQDIRSKTVLDDVFGSDSHTWLSVTSHSGEIASILRVFGHRPFSLNTGAVIPVLVKAETVSGTPASTAMVPYTTISTCSTQPSLPTATV